MKMNKLFLPPPVIYIALLLIFFGFQVENISGANFTVTRNDDRNAICVSGVDCSLREAVAAANAAVTDDIIDFAGGLTLITLASGDTGDIVIENNGALAINGPGANILAIDGGAGKNRIFYTNQAAVKISGLTLQGGNGSGNSSSDSGGAIFAKSGTISLDSVVVQNNGGDAVIGGGVYLSNTSGASIANSTFTGNNAVHCGGLHNSTGTVAIMNTTFSGNSANFNGFAGGALCNSGGMNIRNSTISGNSAPAGSGGAIHNIATIDIGNTIIAGNTASMHPEIRNQGTIISSGNNLIGDSAGDAANTFDPITYQTAVGKADILDTLPLLGALQDNGGTTPTRALQPGSPAIDKGNNILAINALTNSPLISDQRGLARIIDGDGNGTATVDIGAYEKQIAPTSAKVFVRGSVTTADGRGIRSVLVTMTDTKGEIQIAVSGRQGHFQFNDVLAGETYIFTVIAKHYKFVQSSKVLTVNEDLENLNFVALTKSGFGF